MATKDHSHGTPERTRYDVGGRRRRGLTSRLREATVTLVDVLTTTANIRPGPDFRPDGDWVCADDRALCKTWAHTAAGFEERVQLTSRNPSAPWEIIHQRPNGTTATIATDLERETAFEIAERFMADLASVPVGIRTGRAAE